MMLVRGRGIVGAPQTARDFAPQTARDFAPQTARDFAVRPRVYLRPKVEEERIWVELGWEECLRCEVRPDCDEEDPRCGRRRVVERRESAPPGTRDFAGHCAVVPEGYVSLPEMAAALGRTEQCLLYRIKNGLLAAERWQIGKRDRWLVPAEEMLRAVREPSRSRKRDGTSPPAWRGGGG